MGLKMNISEHAKILGSYISRMTLNDIETILRASRECQHQALNGNSRSQLDAHYSLFGTIEIALGEMLTHDRDNIAKTINSVIERE